MSRPTLNLIFNPRAVRAGGVRGLPFVTLAVIAACLWMYGVEVHRYGWSPSAEDLYLMHGVTRDAVTPPIDWRAVVEANFLHVNVVHLLNNVVVIALIGLALERLIGTVRCLVLVALACLAASFGGGYLSSADTVGVGASGIAFAMTAAAVVIDLRAELGLGRYAWQLLILNGFLTFTTAGISIGAHLGGAAAGVVVGFACRDRARAVLGGESAVAARPMPPVVAADTLRVVPPTAMAWWLVAFGVGSGVIAAIELSQGSAGGWLGIGGLVLVPLGLAQVLPGAAGMVVTTDGFVVRWAYRTTRTVAWSAIAEAGVVRTGKQRGVWYRLKPEYRRPGKLSPIDGQLSPRAWSIPLDELAALFHDHAPEAWQEG